MSTALPGTDRIPVEFLELPGAPGVFYLVLRFREGWQAGHFRIAAGVCWATIQERVPPGQQCYSIFLLERGSRLHQAGLVGEVMRAIRHPVFPRIAMTYVVGLDAYAATIAVQIVRVAAWMAATPAPYTVCASLDAALAAMRQHANGAR